MKYCIILFLPLFFVSPSDKALQAQDLATALAEIQQAEQYFPQKRLVLDSIRAIRVGTLNLYFGKAVSEPLSQLLGKRRKMMCTFPCRMGHVIWCVTYADGFQAYNSFRSYRTAKNIAAYYLGQGGDGSWYYCGKRKVKGKLSYGSPRSALMMLRDHGRIIDVSFYRRARWIRINEDASP